jgi:ElaB/YqjD/DUF883 family membrane-anchored ribosome-binding protein
MAKPLHRSSDVPSFDTYPSGPQLAEDTNRLLPEEAETSTLEHYGAQLGSAAGVAVLALRRAQERVRNLASEKSARVTDIASARVQEVREEAATRAEELGRTLRERTFEIRRQARNGIYRARLRARELQNDYPLQVVIGAGVVGVVIGAGLRIWRANRV